MKGWARTVICLYVLWQSFYAGHELKFVKLAGPISGPACLRKVAEKAPYEKKVGLMRGYQDVTMAARTQYPSGLWYTCFPQGHDPRDEKGSMTTVEPQMPRAK